MGLIDRKLIEMEAVNVGTRCGFIERSKVRGFKAHFQVAEGCFRCLCCVNVCLFSIVLICRVEYVTITPDGFRYRSQIFPTVNGLFRWFKDHYHEPVPGRE